MPSTLIETFSLRHRFSRNSSMHSVVVGGLLRNGSDNFREPFTCSSYLSYFPYAQPSPRGTTL